ncbi:uncharacterized protein M421DRAFT_125946 [Didymella exigua CBS 183.55]|uniref:Uncharacterized protein n=1 Tax=Didymella exigua CBS 183.55 TaxID=1150837 RepID=A0A6A5RPR8_9PLEO|nr:uncharacterized protein M421DRAFT_125946 [Didymella exigua CBS 183.55]KAF1929649.1 hypothetical protein M421DRAFT_125946 [Didymella exigua CBS 183.55]
MFGRRHAAACRQHYCKCKDPKSSEHLQSKQSLGATLGQIAGADQKRGLTPRWLVNFLGSFRSILPSSRFALSRLCPEAYKIQEPSSTSVL